MATSGTYAFNLTVGEIVEEAYERCGVKRGDMTRQQLKSAIRALNLLLSQHSAKIPNLFTIDEWTQALTADDPTYTLKTGCIDVLEATIRTGTGTSQVDRWITRISRAEYASYSQKNQSGPPTVFFVDRQIVPTITLWPVPDLSTYTLVTNLAMRAQDITSNPGSENPDVPPFYLEAICGGLAYKLAFKEAPDRLGDLKIDYDESLETAMTEDHERVPLVVAPDMSGYSV